MTEQVHEFKRKVFVFKLDGNEYRVAHPKMYQIEKMQEDQKANPDDLKVTYKLMAELGVKEDISRGMEPEMLQFIIEKISGAKKK